MQQLETTSTNIIDTAYGHNNNSKQQQLETASTTYIIDATTGNNINKHNRYSIWTQQQLETTSKRNTNVIIIIIKIIAFKLLTDNQYAARKELLYIRNSTIHFIS